MLAIPIQKVDLAYSNIADEYTEWSASTTYNTGDRCKVTITTEKMQEKVYICTADSTTGQNPPDNLTGDTPLWVEEGATNKWKMFDQYNNTQTEAQNTITVYCNVSDIDIFALRELDAHSVNVTYIDNSSGATVFTQTYDLRYDQVADVYEYTVKPFQYKKDLTLYLTPYYNATLQVTITKQDSTVKCGFMLYGQSMYMGDSLAEPAPSVTRETTGGWYVNAFDSYNFERGKKYRVTRGDISFNTNYYDLISERFEELHDQLALYIFDTRAENAHTSLSVLGFAEQPTLSRGVTQSTGSITLQGVT